MATLVFRLKYVPDEEAEEIRQLLTDHDIPFYETSAGRWQISLAGLWVKDKEQALYARTLIKADQVARSKGMVTPSFRQWIQGYCQHACQNPIEAFFTLLAVVLILIISIAPFVIWF